MVLNNSLTVQWTVIILLIIWLGTLTYLLLRTLANYNRLTQGVSKRMLSDLLQDFLKREDVTQKQQQDVLKTMAEMTRASKKFIQKTGLVRFNPFADTGGDQSFVLVLLDGQDDGVALTSLYSRTGVRWYIKTIKKGKGIEHDLSKEEKEALKLALGK